MQPKKATCVFVYFNVTFPQRQKPHRCSDEISLFEHACGDLTNGVHCCSVCCPDLICFPLSDPSAMGFIISPWSLLLMPSGNISFTDEYVTQQDLRAFTAPEVLEGLSLNSVSEIEKVQTAALQLFCCAVLLTN